MCQGCDAHYFRGYQVTQEQLTSGRPGVGRRPGTLGAVRCRVFVIGVSDVCTIRKASYRCSLPFMPAVP